MSLWKSSTMVAMVTLLAAVGPEAGCYIRVQAQAPLDPTGHWEGELPVPNNPVAIAFDLVRGADGSLAGTFSQPAQGINGLPLRQALLEDRVLTVVARDDQPFSGTLADDGRSVNGVLSAMGYDIPLTLTRTGEARIEPPVQSDAVDPQLVGTWMGMAGQEPITLTIANRDGSATAELVNDGEGGLRVPVRTITSAGNHVVLELKAISGAYEGDLNAAGTEITGSYKQGPVSGSITFRKK